MNCEENIRMKSPIFHLLTKNIRKYYDGKSNEVKSKGKIFVNFFPTVNFVINDLI